MKGKIFVDELVKGTEGGIGFFSDYFKKNGKEIKKRFFIRVNFADNHL